LLCEKPAGLEPTPTPSLIASTPPRPPASGHMTAFTYRFVPAMVLCRAPRGLRGSGPESTTLRAQTGFFRNWGPSRPGLAAGFRPSRAAVELRRHAVPTGSTSPCSSRGLSLRGGRSDPALPRRPRTAQPSDLEDSVGVLADFANGASGVFESNQGRYRPGARAARASTTARSTARRRPSSIVLENPLENRDRRARRRRPTAPPRCRTSFPQVAGLELAIPSWAIRS